MPPGRTAPNAAAIAAGPAGAQDRDVDPVGLDHAGGGQGRIGLGGGGERARGVRRDVAVLDDRRVGGLAGVGREAQRRGHGQAVVAAVGDDHFGGALGARALGDEQADRAGADDEHALPATRPRRTACSATDVGSTSPAARAGNSTRCAKAAGNTSREAIAPSMCTIPVSVRRAHRCWRPARQRTQTPQPIATSPTTRSPGEKPVTPRADVHDLARPLVAGHDRVRRDPHPEVGQRALEDLDVGAADADRGRRDQQLALAGGRVRALDELEPFTAVEFDCTHSRIEQPSKQLRTRDDGDGTPEGIASRRDDHAGSACTGSGTRTPRARGTRPRIGASDRRRPSGGRPRPWARAGGPRDGTPVA